MKENKEIFPSVFVYENTVKNPDLLINLSKKRDGWRDGYVRYPSQEEHLSEHRIVKILDVPNIFNSEEEWFHLKKSMWQYGNDYGIKNKISFSEMENPQILWYEPSLGFYNPHCDDGPGLNRIFSAVLYLNTVRRGGETKFVNFDISVNPIAGRLIMFPANYSFKHEARPSETESKFVAVTWFKQ